VEAKAEHCVLVGWDQAFGAHFSEVGEGSLARDLEDVLPIDIANPISIMSQHCTAVGLPVRFVQTVRAPDGPRLWEIGLSPVRRRRRDARVQVACAQAERNVGRLPDESVHQGDLAFTLDKSWRITGASRAVSDWWGVPRSGLVGLDARPGLLFPGNVFAAFQRTFATGAAASGVYHSTRHPGVLMEMRTHAIEGGLSAHSRPVSEQYYLEHLAGFVTPTSPIWAMDDTNEMVLLNEVGEIVNVSLPFRDLLTQLGVEGPRFGIGELYVDVCRRIAPDLDSEALRRGVAGVAAGKRGIFSQAFPVVAATGVQWRQVRIAKVRIAGAPHLIAIHEDLAEIARAREGLRKAVEGQVSARESERRMIAAELHDSTGQHLAAASLSVLRLRRLIGQRRGAQEVLDDLTTSLQEAVREIRVVSYLLKPPRLHRDGLEETLRHLVRGFAIRAGLEWTFDAVGDLKQASETAAHVAFRLVQETLSNIHRHAEARRVEVELALRDGGLLELRIKDDGKGLTGPQSGSADNEWQGVGISGMRARVNEVGGSFDIFGGNPGTIVTAAIPSR
jgi:signal transduction histidine kinase